MSPHPHRNLQLPGEPDMFWPDKPLEQLTGTRRAIAEDNVFILNSPPNREGVMPPQNRARLAELRKQIGLGGSPD